MQAHAEAAATATGVTLPIDACHGLDDVEARAWFGLLHSCSALVRELDGDLVASHRLPLNAFEVLLRLSAAEDGQMRMSELARSVVLSLSGLSRLVDRLEREGLVERRSCPHDARGFYASLTDAGRRRLLDAQADHFADVRRRFLDRFTPAELEQLAALWARLAPAARARA